MANFLTAQKTAREIRPSKVRSDLFQFIRSIEKELVAYNTATIFEDSRDVKGKPIGFYSYATELITKGRKAKGQPFDLMETGDFLDSFFAKVGRNSIQFGATDPKLREVLENLLTNDIFGLQDDDLNKVINDRFLPFLLKYYRLNLGI